VTYFYRRSLELRSGVRAFVVYAVLPTHGKPDPVPVIAGFPPGAGKGPSDKDYAAQQQYQVPETIIDLDDIFTIWNHPDTTQATRDLYTWITPDAEHYPRHAGLWRNAQW